MLTTVIVILLGVASVFGAPGTVLLTGGAKVELPEAQRDIEKLRIVCYRPENRTLEFEIFKEVFLDLSVTVTTYYVSTSESDVLRQYREEADKFWSSLLRSIAIFPYSNLLSDPSTRSIKLTGILENTETCAAFESYEAVSVNLRVEHWSRANCLLFLAALGLFLSAKRLARSAVAYYSVGSSVGVLAAFLLVLFVATRFISARKLAVFATVSTFLGGLFARVSAFNVRAALLSLLTDPENLPYVGGYAALSATLTLAVLFYLGPPRSSRALAVLERSVQIVALALLYYSVQHSKAALGLVVSLLLLHVARSLTRLLRRKRASKSRLLTQREYRQQADLYTQQCLDELRSYCRSKKCDSWRLVGKLRDPSRFASFVDGDCRHVTDSERTLHDSLESNADVLSDVSDPSDSQSVSDVSASQSSSESEDLCDCAEPQCASRLASRLYTSLMDASQSNASQENKRRPVQSNSAFLRNKCAPGTKLNGSLSSSTPIRNRQLSQSLFSKENFKVSRKASGDVRYVKRRTELGAGDPSSGSNAFGELINLVGNAVSRTRDAFSRTAHAKATRRDNVFYRNCEPDQEIIY